MSENAPNSPDLGNQFPSEFRVTSRRDFERIFKNKTVVSDPQLVLFLHPNGLEYPRIGTIVSKRVGNAPTRNRWKRVIREAFRLNREKLPAGFDFVVQPRRGAVPKFDPIVDSLVRLAKRAKNRWEKQNRQ
jgi:ribonuclease P protein component